MKSMVEYRQRRPAIDIILAIATIIGLAVAYSASDGSSTTVKAVKLALRAAALKSIEVGIAIYDPYHPRKAKLGPDDWRGWPEHVFDPRLAIERLQSFDDSSRDRMTLVKFFQGHVSDEAAEFSYQPYDVPELRDLRERYRVPTLSKDETPRVAELAVLNDWVRRQWIHGVEGHVDFEKFYAGDVFEATKSKARYWCQIASMTFIQVVSSLGYQARLVSLSEDQRGSPDHAVAEVWVDDLEKWVVFDTDFNLYYVDGLGAPLNALEIHRSLLTDKKASLKVRKGPYRPEVFDVEEASAQPLLTLYYRYFFVDMRNDWMTNAYFPGHPKRSDKATLHWRDEGKVAFSDLIPSTSDETKLYWPLNQVEVRLGVSRDKVVPTRLDVYLKTITPNFDRFEVSVNDGASFSHKSSRLVWQLKSGLNILTVRAVNAFGVKGRSSRLEIIWSQVENAA